MKVVKQKPPEGSIRWKTKFAWWPMFIEEDHRTIFLWMQTYSQKYVYNGSWWVPKEANYDQKANELNALEKVRSGPL